MPLQRAVCDLSSVARGAEALARHGRGRDVTSWTSRGPGVRACDSALVRRVIENLVGNGIRHTPTRGR